MKKDNKKAKLTKETISKAVRGDLGAIEEVLQFYDAYITSLATFENESQGGKWVDPDVKAEMQHKLIDGIRKWKAVL